jgi:nitrite reductase/ring-hydroxylating ferredoxin subunit
MAIREQNDGTYVGYFQRDVPEPDAEITRVGPGTPCGEFMRRYWHPVALSSDVVDLPRAVRILGEDLVVFRDRANRVGVLHRHCSHRGTSLEYGIPSERGIRCCYHGWLFDVDGRILETPGEPPESRLKESFVHGAYPAEERHGLIFAYMGPPEAVPEFPVFDTYFMPRENRLVPYSLWQPCNWLQIRENGMDPIHAVFLHSRMNEIHFTQAWGEMPVYEFFETDDGMFYLTTRRVGDYLWVRSAQYTMPNIGQTGALWEDAVASKYFGRVSLTRWIVPVDDENSWVFGLRHFNDEVDPDHKGREDLCGHDSVDFVGQDGNRPYEERQRDPGDWDAQVSQRPIAVHALEHFGSTDVGVAMMRRILRRTIRGEKVPTFPVGRAREERVRYTYAHDTVLRVPADGKDDEALCRAVGRKVIEAIRSGDDVPDLDERRAVIEQRLRAIETDAG